MSSKLVPKPFNEQERVEALKALAILDTPREIAFDRIARLAAAVMRTPVALISLVDEDRQWFKSCVGVDLESSPREIAFCAHAIMGDDILVVLDATKDPRFRDNPFVTGEAHLRFYAGAPLVTRDKFRIGTLCVLDSEPRTEVTTRELALMNDLAVMAVKEIEGRHLVRHANDVLSQQLAVAEAQASAGETAKANLMAMLSHELRTPLHAIIGFSEVLSAQTMGPLGNPEYKEYAEQIRQSGVHLLGLVGTLLNFASCERGEIALNDDTVDPGQIVAHCVGLMSERARTAQVELASESVPGVPKLLADRNQVIQMLLNLIGNAIKFNRQGGTVKVSANYLEGRVVLTVTDTGIGMAPELLEKSRGAFDQLEAGLARSYEGIGLGLPLTERLIELHGGSLELKSAEGQGTTAAQIFPSWRNAADQADAPLKSSLGS